MPRTFDTAALRRPVAASEVRLHRQQVLRAEHATRGREIPRGLIGGWAVATVSAPLLVGNVAAVAFDVPVEGAVAVGGLIFVVGLAVGIFGLLRDSGRIGVDLDLEPWRRQLRCLEFATANELEYAPWTAVADYPGIVFRAGQGRQTVQRIWSRSGSFFDVGIQRYASGHDEHAIVYEWGYAAFALPGVLPYLLLNSRIDETAPGDLSEFGAADRIQSLGGVMDEFFTLYCRPQYRADAFYVFTPDVMALLIDHASDLDVEVAADWLFFYSRFRLQVSDPETWARVAVLADKIVPLISARARSYRSRGIR